jgi:hypothetical protein
MDIKLEKDQAAIVFRDDDTVELMLPDYQDDDEMDKATMIATAIMSLLQNDAAFVDIVVAEIKRMYEAANEEGNDEA